MMLPYLQFPTQKRHNSWRRKPEPCARPFSAPSVRVSADKIQTCVDFWGLRAKKIPYMVTCGTPFTPAPPLYLEQKKHNLKYQKGQKKKKEIGAASPFQNKLQHPSSTSQTTRSIAQRLVTAPSAGGGASASFHVLLLTPEPLPLWSPSCECQETALID